MRIETSQNINITNAELLSVISSAIGGVIYFVILWHRRKMILEGQEYDPDFNVTKYMLYVLIFFFIADAIFVYTSWYYYQEAIKGGEKGAIESAENVFVANLLSFSATLIIIYNFFTHKFTIADFAEPF